MLYYKMEDSAKYEARVKELNRIRAKRFYEKNKEKINLKRRGYEKETLEEIPIIPFKGKKLKIIDEEGNPVMDIEAINAKGNITSTTRRNYENELKRIQKYNEGRQIINTPNDHLIKVVNAMSRGNNGTALKYINLIVVVKQHFDIDVKEIFDERDRLFKEQPEHTAKLLEKKNAELPELSVLVDYTKKLFDEEKYQSYVINYLLIKYGVRNKDLNVFITDNKQLVKKNNDQNYLYVKANSIDYIRNDYKTVNIYGGKIYNITDKKFLQAVKSLDNDTYLLNPDRKIHESILTDYVKRHTYNKLTESDYFKINMKHAFKSEATQAALKKLSESRGTSYDNLIKYYTMGNSNIDDIEL
jgi:hypothetical protein